MSGDLDLDFENYFEKVQKNLVSEIRKFQGENNYTNLYMSCFLGLSSCGYDKLVSPNPKKDGCTLRTLCMVFYYTEINPSDIFSKTKD